MVVVEDCAVASKCKYVGAVTVRDVRTNDLSRRVIKHDKVVLRGDRGHDAYR